MTLQLYLARRFGQALVLVGGALWGILMLIDIVEKMRSFDPERVGLREAAILAALNTPASVYTILPLIVVLAAVVLFLGLARSSELVVIRAAGRSALRATMAPVAVALILGLLAVGIGNPIVSATQRRYEALAERYGTAAGQTVSIGREGVWMRQDAGRDADPAAAPGASRQAVIRAARANLDATRLYDATFLITAPNAGPLRRIDAEEAELVPGAWLLRGTKDWPLGTSTNPERDATTAPTLRLPSDLTPERIRDSFGTPSAVAFWDLPGFISALKAAGFSARRHQVWFQMELAQPLVLAGMVLIAGAFTMRHARLARVGSRVLLALGGGLAVFFLRNVAQVLGENGQIPILLAAWAPPAIALMLSLTLILYLEDG
ncbi:MAG: LPS export ABC transporter permease LptG [Sphingomonadales bacterium]|nr:LPS export ABC transporter permease LptG [Sphingomonadales bacterium]